jgi:hypothetical protein
VSPFAASAWAETEESANRVMAAVKVRLNMKDSLPGRAGTKT